RVLLERGPAGVRQVGLVKVEVDDPELACDLVGRLLREDLVLGRHARWWRRRRRRCRPRRRWWRWCRRRLHGRWRRWRRGRWLHGRFLVASSSERRRGDHHDQLLLPPTRHQSASDQLRNSPLVLRLVWPQLIERILYLSIVKGAPFV